MRALHYLVDDLALIDPLKEAQHKGLERLSGLWLGALGRGKTFDTIDVSIALI